MGVVRFIADKTSKRYSIVENTDEYLFVIAQLLLNKQARTSAEELINHEEHKTLRIGPFHFRKEYPNLLAIQLFDQHTSLSESNPLEITIEKDNLDRLISAWELYALDPSLIITLHKDHDSNIVQLFTEPSL